MGFETLLVEEQLIRIAESQLTDPKNLKRRHNLRREYEGLLYAIQVETFRSVTIEQLGRDMDAFIDGEDRAYEIPPNYWRSFKSEFNDFLCTQNKKYADLRTKLRGAGTKSQTTIVSMIAAAVAVHIGIAAGALVPFCALCLLAVARIGVNAFCDTDELNIKIEKQPKKAKRK